MQQIISGTRYSTTVAFVAAALIFSPALLVLSQPMRPVTAALAIASSVICLVLAWRSWRKHSRLTIETIETIDVRPPEAR